MTRRVWKYVIPVDDQPHRIPSWPVHVAPGYDPGYVLAWCEIDDQPGAVDPDHIFTSDQAIDVQVYGTNHPIPDNALHIGTAVWEPTGGYAGPPLVWHVYCLEEGD